MCANGISQVLECCRVQQSPPMQAHEAPHPASCPPERFVVEVFSELHQETIHKRWQHLNVLLRLSMLTGLQMQLDATLNMLCDMAAEITSFAKALIYFWDEGQEQVQLRIVRGFQEKVAGTEGLSSGNILNFWATKYGRPLLITRGHNLQADALLELVQ